MLGTPIYMGPELYDRKLGVTEKVDIWALGCILTEMLSGEPPWAGSRAQQIMTSIIVQKETPPIPAGLPSALADVIGKCFSFDPVDRPAARDVVAALQAIESSSGELSRTPSSAAERIRLPAKNFAVIPPGDARQYDFYINHCQTSGGDQCKVLFDALTAAGATCWFSTQRQDMTAQGMEEGVRNSRNLLVFLSDDVMGRPFCNTEQRWAIMYECNMVGVVETDPEHGAADMAKEKARAPEDLKHLLDEIDFIDFERRDYLLSAMVKEVLRRGRNAEAIPPGDDGASPREGEPVELDLERPMATLPRGPGTEAWAHADSLLANTWIKRDRFQYLSLETVQEVDNPRLLHRYINFKSALSADAVNGNELLVFHGCAADAEMSICEGGFQRKYWKSSTGEWQRFGPGCECTLSVVAEALCIAVAEH